MQICGAKTKKCEECGEYVKVLEMDVHKSEGWCEAMKISKDERNEKETQKALEKFQQERLK